MAINAGTAFINVLADMSGFNASMQKGLISSRQQFANTGKQLTKFITLPILAAAAASVKLAVDFEQSMTRVQSLAGQSRIQVEKWGEEILGLAGKVGRPPQELADALYFVASSGVEASKVMGVVEVSAKAAAAGLGDTAVVADLVTSAMNAYAHEALSAAEVTDTLVEAVKLGKGEASDFAPVLGQILPVSSELGVEFNEVAAGLAAMTTTGIDAAEGATRLRAIFSSLLKVTPAQEKAFQAVGLSADQLRASLDQRGLLPTLQLIDKAVKGDTESLAAMFPNVRALQGVLALVGNNADNVNRIFKDMADSTGALDKAFQITTGDSAFKMQQAFANLQVAAIRFGEILLPVVTTIVEAFGSLFEAVADLPAPVLSLIEIFGGLAAAMGPFIYLFAKIPEIVKNIKVAFNQMGALVTNPFFLVITGIVAALLIFNTAMHAAEKAHEAFVKATKEASTTMVENLDRMANAAQATEAVFRVKLRAILSEIYDTFGPEKGNELFRKFVKAGPQALAKALAQDEELAGKVHEAMQILGQTMQQAFKNGNITAEELALGLAGMGKSAEEITSRMLQAATAIKDVDISGLIDATREYGVVNDASKDKLLALTELMASRGEITSTEFADTLIKLGFSQDEVNEKVQAFSGTLEDTAGNLDIAGRAVSVFTFGTMEDFKKWANEIQDDFESFVEGAESVKKAFKGTAAQAQKSLDTQVEVARTATKDLRKLLDGVFARDSDFVQWLIDKGPAAIHQFVEGSKTEQAKYHKTWEDLNEITSRHEKLLGDLGKVTVSSRYEIDTEPARTAIKTLNDDLKDMGFTISKGGSLVFGQVKHGGGMSGAGGMTGISKPKGDEILSLLQKGEFVVQRSVVNKPGMLAFLEALNSGRYGGEYHSGGLADATSRMNLLNSSLLATSLSQLKSTLENGSPDFTRKLTANLPTADEIIDKMLSKITGTAGGNLTPNAARYEAVIAAMFPQVQGFGGYSRRFIAGTNTWSQHAYGNAIDVMTGSDTALRYAVAQFSDARREMLSIAHLLADPWFKSPRGDHYNHVHADFFPQGTGTPPLLSAARGFHGRLRQDTTIRAHAGELVNITPAAASRGSDLRGELRIRDWKRGIATLEAELDWDDMRRTR